MSDLTERARVEATTRRVSADPADMCHGEGWRLGFVEGAAWAAEQEAETIAGLRAEARAAHDRLVWECASMSWATDGRLSTGVGHAVEMIRREQARADAAEGKVRAVEAERDDYRDSPRDEHHTMAEVYDYRMLYNAHAARGWLAAGIPVVKARRHSDGEPCFGGGWFIVTATLPTGQVSNHYRDENWDLFDVPEVDLPPEYDGHTPAIAADRLRAALATPEPTVPLATPDFMALASFITHRPGCDERHGKRESCTVTTEPTVQAWPQEDS